MTLEEASTSLFPLVTRWRISMLGYTKMDLGITKLHFEIGAGKENFDWA